MSRMMVGDDKSSSSGPHDDFWRNLSKAKKFIVDVYQDCPNGVSVYIGDIEKMGPGILWISFQNPIDINGNYFYKHAPSTAIPISMHKMSYEFDKECRENFDNCRKKAYKFTLNVK